MSSRSSPAFVLVACLLAGGLLGLAPAAAGEPDGPHLKRGKARHGAAEPKRRFRSVRVRLPMGPGYVYQDYPYYYYRGYYPTHIGGYVYYPYYYYRRYYPRSVVGPGPR